MGHNTFVQEIRLLSRNGAIDIPVISFDINGGLIGVNGVPIINIKYLGAAGNGASDDLPFFQAAVASLPYGGIITCEPNKTYICTDTLELVAGITLDLNGSTLRFVLVGDKLALQPSSRCNILNGTVEVQISSLVATGGDYGCPIVIGDYAGASGTTGRELSQVVCHNLTLKTNRTGGGNCILVTGPCHDITLDGLHFPASSTLGNGVVVTPGSDVGRTEEYFPYNITVRNLNFEDQTATTGGAVTVALVVISGARNGITVENVTAKETHVPVIYVSVSDLGVTLGSTEDQLAAFNGITLDNIVGTDCRVGFIHIDGLADNVSPSAVLYSFPIVVKNIRGVGNGASSTSQGLRIVDAKDVSVYNPELSKFKWGIEVDDGCVNVSIYKPRCYENWREGILIDGASAAPVDTHIFEPICFLNGQEGDSGSANGVTISTSIRTVVDWGIFGHETALSEIKQLRGVKVESGAVYASIRNCYVQSMLAGSAAFVLAGASDFGSVWEFQGNSSAAGLAHRAGLTHIPVRRWVNGSDIVNTELVTSAGAAPAAGAWKRGDRCYYEDPSASGFIGEVCTTAGTPGTWKTFAPISA